MTSKPPTSSPRPSSSDHAAIRCGYVALVGRPNAGKSTLFNAFLGQRLSIVTPKPQTTRSRVLGVLTRPDAQLILLDTPGLLEPEYRLHQAMEHQILHAALNADVVLLLVDGERPRDRWELVQSFVAGNKLPVVPILNKIDLLSPEKVGALRQELSAELGLGDLVPVSALRGDHVSELVDRLAAMLPLGPKLYPDDMIAEQPERFFVAELIREAAFNHLSEELPYAITVTIETFKERASKTYIEAIIYVERESQKGIVIGRRGARLRAIGTEARRQIEELVQASVYLDLWVKVRPDWRKHERDLREFGYL